MAAANPLSIDYTHCLQAAVGAEHAITRADLEALAPRITEVVSKIEAARGKERLYRELPYRQDYLHSVLDAVEERDGQFENLVVLGIGGSALGNIALQTALRPATWNLLDHAERGGPRVFICDNIDPDAFSDLMHFIRPRLNKTLFNVISKSGETAETASQYLIIRDLVEQELGEAAVVDHILVTTDEKAGTMRKIADDEAYDTLVVPDGVGGRFSVLSPVGLFSAAMAGINVEALLKGAADMDERCKVADLFTNPAAMLAAVHYLFYQRGKVNAVMMPYSSALKDLADWYRQLWAESLGKEVDRHGRRVNHGQMPIKALGTTDQHSQVQLYREGPNNTLFVLLEVENFERPVLIPNVYPDVPQVAYLGDQTMGKLINAEKRATEFALAKSERPSLTIKFPMIDESTVGQFIYLYECATSIVGELLDINAYDQPAVELGKQATFALMGRPGYEQMANEMANTPTPAVV